MWWNFPDRLFAGPERFEIFAQAQENRRPLSAAVATIGHYESEPMARQPLQVTDQFSHHLEVVLTLPPLSTTIFKWTAEQ